MIPRSNKLRALVMALAVVFGASWGLVLAGCGGSTQASRASTISSLDTGIQSATAALASYEHQHTESIISAATDLATARAAISAFRARVDKVWIAVNAARAAIDAANTINDDTSVKGAQKALADAITAVTALTGGTP
jgi:hypothetical protein